LTTLTPASGFWSSSLAWASIAILLTMGVVLLRQYREQQLETVLPRRRRRSG
jgi:hypothetical protein